MRSPVQIARGLCDEAGFDHQVVNDLQVEAAVRRSCGNSPAAGDHAQRLETDPAAREALLEELLVRESWFYRDQRPFEMLERMALGEWRQRSSPPRGRGGCAPFTRRGVLNTTEGTAAAAKPLEEARGAAAVVYAPCASDWHRHY